MKKKNLLFLGLLCLVVIVLSTYSVIFKKGSRVVAVYASNDNKPGEVLRLTVAVIDPLSEKIISQRTAALTHPLSNNSVIYDRVSRTLYAKTFYSNGIDTGMDSTCPEITDARSSTGCFIGIESFSLSGTDQPVVVATYLVGPDQGTMNPPVGAEAGSPFYRLLDPKYSSSDTAGFGVNTGNNTVDPKISVSFTDKQPTTVTVSNGKEAKDFLFDIESVFYVTAPDAKSVYITETQYNRKQARGTSENPYQVGIKKIDLVSMTATEATKNILPKTFAPDGTHFLGTWAAAGKTVLVLFNTQTNERKEISVIDRPSTGSGGLNPADYLLLEWIR